MSGLKGYVSKTEKGWVWTTGPYELPHAPFGPFKTYAEAAGEARRSGFPVEKKGIKKNPRKKRKAPKRRTRKVYRPIGLKYATKRAALRGKGVYISRRGPPTMINIRHKIGATRNPIGKFVICATIINSRKHWYFRQSTESFVDGLSAATRYKSAAHAWRVAQSLKNQLPRQIKSIKVDKA